ncbi:RAP domain-containing protein [Theileria equi strain WA]|uniref:RAP domain-containing protein n=1 Tax=Theileria equi strain WA TaxID=1537102 RepID=L0B1F1_THEEQ|nr:RAP domain-containing protein [Theileria equi strain WA]AFZ81697.1 RAP domain-containing protein [Theileria equi strain WA]|eukprot:XP_004831363.1 RAP domain-containing protein [Theileria equi strain WA]
MLSKLYVLMFRNLDYRHATKIKASLHCKNNRFVSYKCPFHSIDSSNSKNTNNDESILNTTSKDGESKGTPKETYSNKKAVQNTGVSTTSEFYFDPDVENLSTEQQKYKQELIKELTRKLSGPLADENGVLPIGDKRPIAIEVDGPSHFYSNSTKYTAYTKLKHRILTRMGYKVLHVPFFEWRRLRGAKEREEYMRAKLKEEPTEWLDPDDEKLYNRRIEALKEEHNAIDALKTTDNA